MSDLHIRYRGYDDEALATLANVGLLRRAQRDVEAGKVAILAATATQISLCADGQTVLLDARGPAHARCDCPAPGMCKHILAAVIYVREQAATEPPMQKPGAAAASADLAAPSALQSALSLVPAEVFREAGRAAVRRAASRFDPVLALVWTEQAASLLIELAQPPLTIRYIAGAGFAGMVSDAAAADQPALHVLALTLLWHAHGRAFAWPAGTLPDAPTAAAAAELTAAELLFLDHVRRALQALFDNGLAHVSSITAQRLQALNMSARASNLPRLAALLRSLAGTLDLLVQRDDRVDEGQALQLMAQVYALCAALEAGEAGEAGSMSALRGQVRRDFAEGADLQLLPLGAYWWHTRGGALGLTLSFWHAETARVLQAVLARPDGSDVGFHKMAAWQFLPLWQGGSSAQRLCDNGEVLLRGARMADDGRIATAGATRAESLPAWRDGDAGLAQLGHPDWRVLDQALRGTLGLRGEPVDCVLLRPSAWAPPVLDEIRQCVDWWVNDIHGERLQLVLPCEPHNQPAIEYLQQLVLRKADLRAVLVRLQSARHAVTLRPVAVMVMRDHVLQPLSLDYADAPIDDQNTLGDRWRAWWGKTPAPLPASAASSISQRLLQPVLDRLEYLAMLGHARPDISHATELRQHSTTLRAAGLDHVSDLIDAMLATPGLETLLRVAYVAQLCIALDGLPLQRHPGRAARAVVNPTP
ncbi:hypothetical protein JCM19000A_28250 [Silvimonas sp. JCM 19000]